MKKILYLMNVDWNWIKQRPHFLAEQLAHYYDITVVNQYRYTKKGYQSRKFDGNFVSFKVVPRIDRYASFRWINVILKKKVLKNLIDSEKPDFIWLTDPDQINWLENYMRLKHVAVTAAVMTEPDGKNVYPWKVPSGWQYILEGVPILHRFVKSSDYQHDFFTTQEEAIEVECVPGSLLMVNVADFLEIDGYDEDIFLYCEETCLGYKLKSAQKKTVLLTSSSYVHDHKRNSSQLLKQRKAIWDSRKIFIRKYYNFSNFDMLLANLLEHFDLFMRAHRR